MNATRYLWEDYYIPSTRTLRNLLGGNDNPDGMLDPVELERIELELVAIRMAELAKAPIVGKFDLTHMKAIHRHLFQDVYEWAGEIRTAPADDAPPMNKDGVAYGPIGRITKIWSAEHSRIKKQDLLHGRDSASEFSEGLARFWGEINHAHAFREGNTRTQTVFFEQLCEQAGYSLNIARLAPQHPQSIREAFIDARYYFQLRGDALPLAETLSKVLVPIDEQQRNQESSAVVGTIPDSIAVARRYPELAGVRVAASAAGRYPELAVDEETGSEESGPSLG